MADNTKIRYICQLRTGRWQTTLKLAVRREYIAQRCYYSLFFYKEGIISKAMKMKKEEARRIVLNCAKLYQQRLLNKKFLIIYRDRKSNQICSIEVVFRERNYQHLTGLELIGKDGHVLYNQSLNFYRKCIENKLGLEEFEFRRDGTAYLKLAALPVLTDITKITKIIGDYNRSRPYLLVDKVIGGVHFCLGLSRDDRIYVPSSALLENIKKLTDAPSQVLAIFEKDIQENLYSTVKHVAKGLNLNHITFPVEIKSMITLETDGSHP